jgi:hypothetical protein
VPGTQIVSQIKTCDRKTYSVLDDNETSLILERDAKIGQEGISRLAHDHSREELATEPSTTTWRDRRFNDSDLEIRTSLAEHVCGAETAGAGTNNDDVGLGVSVQVLEVALSHGARHLGLADRSEREI